MSSHSQPDRHRSQPHASGSAAGPIPAGGNVEIDGVTLKLAHPYDGPSQWIGQQEVLTQLLACWLTVDATDLPLTPRLVGPPGIGKTQLAIAAAQTQRLPLFIYQCTADTRPEDLLVTPVLSQAGQISYHASPLVTAMITGGVLFPAGLSRIKVFATAFFVSSSVRRRGSWPSARPSMPLEPGTSTGRM